MLNRSLICKDYCRKTKQGDRFYCGKADEPAGYINCVRLKSRESLDGLKAHGTGKNLYKKNVPGSGGLARYLSIRHCHLQKKVAAKCYGWVCGNKMKKALQFYKRNGFEIFGEQIFTLGSDDQVDWLMKRLLLALWVASLFMSGDIWLAMLSTIICSPHFIG